VYDVVPPAPSAEGQALAEFVRRHPRLVVLTGAGCSVASGIPEYRDHEGNWKARPPVTYAAFVSSEATRKRYWARSMFGWERVAAAAPGAAHRALARLERVGHVRAVVTQNVDSLHQRAGSRRVVDLHGRLDEVECLDCGTLVRRGDLQKLLQSWNAGWRETLAADRVPAALPRPDGDVDLEHDFADFRVPDCPACGGVLKPAVVFFGENVPRGRVESALEALRTADALLVVGSSLAVYSGYRFCLAARDQDKPVAAVNLGRTRADDLLALKVVADCGRALSEAAARLAPSEVGFGGASVA
jgi:NAD-dependent SIR2 family protein deacetylase